MATPGYFEAMGIHVAGQTLTWGAMNAHSGDMIVLDLSASISSAMALDFARDGVRGIVSVVGGKITGYRDIAEEVVRLASHLDQFHTKIFGEEGAGDFDETQVSDVVHDAANISVEEHDLHLGLDTGGVSSRHRRHLSESPGESKHGDNREMSLEPGE